MAKVPEKALDMFVQYCRKAADRGLMRCSSGNLSLRLDGGRLLVTSSGSWMEDISHEQISVCRMSDGSLIEGGKPTVEIGFHTGIMRGRPDVNVVMHFQTPSATTLGCRLFDGNNFFVIPEIPFYIGPIARVPYFIPGSKELAEAVADAMINHDMVIMSNHGMVTVGNDFKHVIQNAEFFELACTIILNGKDSVETLPEDEVNKLLELRLASNKS